ncbi:alpha/beta hydrolase-fold protein [uncultured Imperialibacter sp.]|uniref:alpha/beta hydrolase-fold protein n=1 Tax=uncultured Imperialibacter sp. TaxID=1672639 RepID=UPI0030DA5FFF|tara:strand:- start:5368 stop:6552 length:1185 start_codon:yes stop_codon:yes gene_type:complete
MKKQLRNTKAWSFLLVLGFSLGLAHTISAQFRRNPVVSPEIHADNKVTFRVYAPNANEINLAGEWMGQGKSEPLVKGDTGLWAITVGPLEPELWGYNFTVDGAYALDASNALVKRDGVRNISFFMIKGKGSDLYETKHGAKGMVSKVWYESPTLGLTRRMYVYTPPGYENSKDSYPVFYLLHGGGGDEDAWTELGVAPTIMDNLINSGQAKPMIVVMTNGNPDQTAAGIEAPAKLPGQEVPGPFGMANKKFEESLVKDVVPYIESHYRAKKGKENRALSGLSMGGWQTLNTTFDNPTMFDYICVMSMGFVKDSPFGLPNNGEGRGKDIDALKKANPKVYWIACGKDDFLYDSVVNLRNTLDEHGFKYKYVESTGGHTWANWRIYLSQFAPVLFK